MAQDNETNGGVHLPDSVILRKLDEVKTEIVGLRSEIMGTDGSGRLPVAERRINSHAERLQKLENWKWQIAGGLAVLVYILEKALHLSGAIGH